MYNIGRSIGRYDLVTYADKIPRTLPMGKVFFLGFEALIVGAYQGSNNVMAQS